MIELGEVPETLREDTFLSLEMIDVGVLFCPRKFLWFLTIDTIKSVLPGLLMLDLAWSSTLSIIQQPA